jgi:uncharacterized membrane protein YedE/YeeE
MAATPADLSTVVVAGGFAVAFVFGAVASKVNFCTMGALSDVVNMGAWGRLRMWLLAIAVAMAGATALRVFGLVDLPKAVALRPQLPLLSLVVGGLLFGVGMTLSGGCANKNLLRLGAGSLRSLVVLVFMGLASYMTLKGLFGQWRVALLDPVRVDLGASGWPDQSLATAAAQLLGLAPQQALLATAAVVVLALLVFVFKDRVFRANGAQVLGGAALGLLVVCGWYVSGRLGFGESPETMENVYFATNTRTVESLSFVAPVAYTLELLMLWTDKSLRITFGIASVLGIVAGAAAYALAAGRFRWEGFGSLADLRSQLLGAVLMGFGGVTALGCTVGQGMTGVSTLAIGSFIAVAAIVTGCVGTLKWLLWKAERDA